MLCEEGCFAQVFVEIPVFRRGECGTECEEVLRQTVMSLKLGLEFIQIQCFPGDQGVGDCQAHVLAVIFIRLFLFCFSVIFLLFSAFEAVFSSYLPKKVTRHLPTRANLRFACYSTKT